MNNTQDFAPVDVGSIDWLGDVGECAQCGAHVAGKPSYIEGALIFCGGVCFVRHMRDEWDDDSPSPNAAMSHREDSL